MKNACLLIIDVQKGFEDADFWGKRNNPYAEVNMLTLMDAFRNAKLPIFHVQHQSENESAPLYPAKLGYQLKTGFEPKEDEPLFIKSVNSAFIGTSLKEELDKKGIQQLIIVGLTTNHCVSTTVRMAANLGYDVCVVHDATAAFGTVSYDGKRYSAQEVHDTALSHLNGEFAEIVSTEEVLTNRISSSQFIQ
ncbi:cysteine hydrolase family protein [Fictibacillus barbaricus]|uniref:Nicotinamidase-related amidase n=1 Tax=Fictibacillus barbaricus TaxID=182136 RepID=A0ABU1TXA2_9BACL|nr:cysteine hydrolase family protein [Fictibacillus barbaricus]MDR7071803.1 nicotinamidase-related amidase [Fictibacillus barbaricus]